MKSFVSIFLCLFHLIVFVFQMVIRLMASLIHPLVTTPGTLCLSVAGKELSEIYHTLAHEFCHLEQWVRDDALWVKWMKRSSRKSTIALEKLTEEEALEMLKKWNLFDDSMEIRKTKYLRRLENL